MKINFYTAPNVTTFAGRKPPKINISQTSQQDTFSFLDKYTNEVHSCCVKNLLANLRKYIASGKDIKESDIKGIAGHGVETVVFNLGEKEVLKCSYENPLEYRVHNPEFDIPFLSPVTKINDTYIVREVKADTKNVTPDDCLDVIRRMDEQGFEPSSDLDKYRVEQVGIYNGKAYLLDTRCALPKPDEYTCFIHNFCNDNRRVYYSHFDINKEDCHVEEIPKANLTLTQGNSMAWKIIKDNIKNGFLTLPEGLNLMMKVIKLGILLK